MTYEKILTMVFDSVKFLEVYKDQFNLQSNFDYDKTMRTALVPEYKEVLDSAYMSIST